MSAGAIAITAILVSGGEGFAVIAAGAWLVYTRRILLAATPKPPAQQPAASTVPPGGTP